jgi:hypothetical protein
LCVRELGRLSAWVLRRVWVLGRYALGRYALGRYALGRYVLGRYALGCYALGRYALGRYALGRYALRCYALGSLEDWTPPSCARGASPGVTSIFNVLFAYGT